MSKRGSTPWPMRLAKDTVLIAHVTHASGFEAWLRLRQDNDAYVWQVADKRGDTWVPRDIGSPLTTIGEALEVNRGNTTVGKGSIVEITTRPEHETTVLRGITPKRLLPQDLDDWPDDIVDEWGPIDDELPVDIPVIDPWATINSARMLFLNPDNVSGHYPVLFDRDEGTFTGLPVLAETSWFSESGGAPISWDGGSRLSRLCPGLLWSQAWGDVRQESETVPANGPEQVGHAVAEFIVADDQQFAAAWLLEPFDTSQRLDAEQSAEWFRLAEGVEVSVGIALEPAEELPACRARLRQDPAYAAVTEALADPTSTRGQRLRAKLEDVNSSGVLGGILGYSLADL